MEQILASIGAFVLAGGGGAAIAFGIMNVFGTKWLEQQFAKRLEAFKHAQQKEMEQVRYRINSYFDRTVRLHQVEFEVLPEIWSRLHEAFYGARSFISRISIEPDLDRMNPAHLEEFLEKSPLMAWQKEELRSEESKLKYYRKAIFFHRLNDTKRAYPDFNGYLMKKGVFIPREIAAKFEAISAVIWDAIVENEINEEMKRDGCGSMKRPKGDALEKEGDELMKELRGIVQNTLRDSKSLLTG